MALSFPTSFVFFSLTIFVLLRFVFPQLFRLFYFSYYLHFPWLCLSPAHPFFVFFLCLFFHLTSLFPAHPSFVFLGLPHSSFTFTLSLNSSQLFCRLNCVSYLTIFFLLAFFVSFRLGTLSSYFYLLQSALPSLCLFSISKLSRPIFSFRLPVLISFNPFFFCVFFFVSNYLQVARLIHVNFYQISNLEPVLKSHILV
jgi:hypothetical protein